MRGVLKVTKIQNIKTFAKIQNIQTFSHLPQLPVGSVLMFPLLLPSTLGASRKKEAVTVLCPSYRDRLKRLKAE